MERMPICRICLVENVRMYIVNDTDLHELYETLTGVPFDTEDRRPTFACYICFARLKQCCQLKRKCLAAEELFAQMMNEPNTLVNQRQLKFFSGLSKTPVAIISMVEVCQIERIDVKEEIPTVCERLDDFIEPKEEHQTDDLELEPADNGYSDVEDTPAHRYSEDSGDDVPLLEFKIDLEEEEILSTERRASDTQQFKLENLKNSYSDTEDIQTQQSESYSGDPLMKIKTEVEEENEESRKKLRASDTQRSPFAKKLLLHKRRRKLEDVTTEEQKQKEQPDAEVIQNTRNYTSVLIPEFKEPLTCTKPRVNISITNTTLDSNCRKNNNKQYMKSTITNEFISSNMNRYRKFGVKEKRFDCDICQRTFKRKDHLKTHSRVHTGEKPFKCDVCQRCFSGRGDLTKHVRMHTGEKPFICDICQCGFSRNTFLTRHIRIHTGEKPYKCDECQRTFNRKDNLTKHIRVHT